MAAAGRGGRKGECLHCRQRRAVIGRAVGLIARVVREDLPGEAQFLPTGEIIRERRCQTFPGVVGEDDLEPHARVGSLEPETQAIVAAPILVREEVLPHAHAPASSNVIHQHHGVASHAGRRERIGERHALGNRGAVIAVGEPARHVRGLKIVDHRAGVLEQRNLIHRIMAAAGRGGREGERLHRRQRRAVIGRAVGLIAGVVREDLPGKT